MGKEEKIPQVTRRSTRSSCSSPAVITSDAECTKASETHALTLNDLVFGGEKGLRFDDLLSSFPSRNIQIHQLIRLLGPLNSPMLPLFIYGGPSTGKTSVILEIFRHLNRPFVYTSCITCYSPRILFESVLNQLELHRKDTGNGYASAKRCDKPSDFVNFLHQDLINVIDKMKGSSGKLSSKGGMIYLIFDNLELVRNWDKSSSILPFMFNLYNILKIPEVGIIFISSTSPDSYYSNMGYVEPIPVYFPEYTEEDLRQILMRNQENRKLYSNFLDVALRPFCRVTRQVTELSTAYSSLFRRYCEPIDDLGNVPNEEMKRRLFSHFQPHIGLSLNETFWVQSRPSHGDENNKEERRREHRRKLEGGNDVTEMDFYMSTSAKYLLISAFLASRNPATLDASMFDSKGGSDNRKRKRKASEKSLDQKETAEQESIMKGPGTFPLERLLAIFQCITSAAEDFLDPDEHGNDVLGTEGDGGDSWLMSDALLQLSSLCNANFIVKGGSCPLEGSTRYRSTVSEDLAMKVARSLKFPLPNYLYRR